MSRLYVSRVITSEYNSVACLCRENGFPTVKMIGVRGGGGRVDAVGTVKKWWGGRINAIKTATKWSKGGGGGRVYAV